uniref:Uncharacterized protein n=1 Tax=viral metagenome TaxID=1070528 RepID=A0A6M3IEF7_9ZZZZ
MFKWWRIKVFGIYLFVLGITVECITKADVGHTIISVASLIFVVGANMRTRYFKKRITSLRKKLSKRGGE